MIPAPQSLSSLTLCSPFYINMCSYIYLFNKIIFSKAAQNTGEGNDKPLQYSCLENRMNSTKRQKDKTLKDELPGSVGAQYAMGDQ